MRFTKAWKDLERRHAKAMGTERIWRQDYGESKPDGETSTRTWDCKCRQGITAVTWFKRARRKYAKFSGDRVFHMVFHIPGEQGDFVMVEAAEFYRLLQYEAQVNPEELDE